MKSVSCFSSPSSPLFFFFFFFPPPPPLLGVVEMGGGAQSKIIERSKITLEIEIRFDLFFSLFSPLRTLKKKNEKED